MKQTKLNIPALLGARICHDMISPVGAISNGLELLSLTGDIAGPEVELIGDSVTNANARLKFFRLAFGVAGADQMVSASEITNILNAYYCDKGYQVVFAGSEDMKKSDVKLLFLLALCCESGMTRRGKVTLYSDMMVRCEGDVLPNTHALFTLLRNGGVWPAELEAAQVHFPLARMALQAADLQIQCALNGQAFNVWTGADLPDVLINREPSRPLRQGT